MASPNRRPLARRRSIDSVQRVLDDLRHPPLFPPIQHPGDRPQFPLGDPVFPPRDERSTTIRTARCHRTEHRFCRTDPERDTADLGISRDLQFCKGLQIIMLRPVVARNLSDLTDWHHVCFIKKACDGEVMRRKASTPPTHQTQTQKVRDES